MKHKSVILSVLIMLFSITSGFCYDLLNQQTVNSFDRAVMMPYSPELDKVGTLMTLGMLVTPGLLVLIPAVQGNLDLRRKEGWKSSLTLGGLYIGSVASAYLIKEGLKHFVDRARPYMYSLGAPENEILSGEYLDSFPSGHTSLAFTSAAFLSVSFCRLFPESKWKGAVIGGSFGCATGVAVLRVLSGCHFTTDIFAGALIGTVCGGLFPLLWVNYKNVGFAFTGNGVNVKIQF